MKLPEITKITNRLPEDWNIKLVSLILSIFLWLFVDSLSIEEISLSLPVQYKNLPSDLVIVKNFHPLIALKVRGKKNMLKKIDLNRVITLKTDLSKAKPGIFNYPIELVNLSPKSDLKILPNREFVTLKIDRYLQKEVAVKPRISGSPKEGFVLESVALEKQNVILEGPAEVLSPLEFIETSTLDISKSDTNFVRTVRLLIPPKTKVIGSSRLSVSIKISEQKITREESFPVKVINLPSDLFIQNLPEVSLLLIIPGRYASSFRENIRVIANCQGIRESGTYRVSLSIEKPDSIRVLNPPKFIFIKLIKQSSR